MIMIKRREYTALRPSTVSVPFNLLDPFYTTKPVHTALGKLLHSGSQLGLLQMEIVHGTDAQDTLSRGPRAHTIHKRAASGTEVVGHVIARGDRARLAEGL